MLTGARGEQEIATLAWPDLRAHAALAKLQLALSGLARQALLVA